MNAVAFFVALMFLVCLCGAIYLAYDVYQYNQRIKRAAVEALDKEVTSRLVPFEVTTHHLDGTTTTKIQILDESFKEHVT